MLSGTGNAFFGAHAGASNRGFDNVFLGREAGNNIRLADSCIALGAYSGPNSTSNVSHRLYIDVEQSNDPLIYGEFDNDLIRINGTLQLGAINYYSNNDDGLIRAPDEPDADLHLVANDAIVLEIGDNADAEGYFEVWNNSATDKLLILDEDGNLDLKGTVGMISDMSRKEQIVPVNTEEILEKLVTIPISEWQYKSAQDRHIGPMAQDFYQAFRFGSSDTRIATIDADGVALASIQALARQNTRLKKEVNDLKRENHELRFLINELNRRMDNLESGIEDQQNSNKTSSQ